MGILLILLIFIIIRKKNVNQSIADDNKEKIKLLHPEIRNKVKLFLYKAIKKGYNLRITSGLRTFEEQTELYNKGRTIEGDIVTNAPAGLSFHNYGLAFDIVDRVNGYKTNWEDISTIAKKIGFEWGGDWKTFIDKPHFQYSKGYTAKQLLTKYNSGKTKKGYVKI